MILAICPNPSIDCTIELDSLNVGKLNRIDSKVETYSGKALNVAMGVARLGEKSLATGFMFDSHAKLFEHNLEKEGVYHKFIYNKGSARTNYKIIDKRSMLTEINDRGETVDRVKQFELIDLVKDLSEGVDVAVMSGSLPKGVESSFYGEVVKNIPKNVKVIIDAEKNNTLSAIQAREIYMVKPNLVELESFVGCSLKSIPDIVKATNKYFDYGVQNVLVSLGGEGAVLTNGQTAYFCKSLSVAVNSTVGAGDSMVAATSVAFEKGLPLSEVLRQAVSAGTAAVTTSGTNLFYREKFDEIYSKVYPEKIF